MHGHKIQKLIVFMIPNAEIGSGFGWHGMQYSLSVVVAELILFYVYLQVEFHYEYLITWFLLIIINYIFSNDSIMAVCNIGKLLIPIQMMCCKRNNQLMWLNKSGSSAREYIYRNAQ